MPNIFAIFLTSLLFLGSATYAQKTPPPPIPVGSASMEGATFKEGNVNTFIAGNLKYPKQALDAKIEGVVLLEFFVETNGTVSESKLVKGIGAGCDEESLRLIGLTNGKWIPSKINGKVVRQKIVLPVVFKLS